MTFDWMNSTPRPDGRETRRRLALEEVAQRAALLQRLGYKRAHIAARLEANLRWDFELGSTAPLEPSDLDAVLDTLGL